MPSRKTPNKHRLLLNQARPIYAKMLADQGGTCALCPRVPSEKRRLDIDHDHKMMYVRGVLCHRCNRNLPTWVTVEWLERAIEYLEIGDPGYATWGLRPDNP
jgi:hypothetical protein